MTRLLLKLRTMEDARYDTEYHRDLQGLIYSILRGSDYDNHDKQGYKFFTFSNIFPFHDLRKNDIRNLLISSPSNDFISYLKEQFDYIQQIRIGRMKFKIDYSDKFNIVSRDAFTLITATPIVARIQKYRYEHIGEQELVDGHDAYYWRSNHPVELFITQLENNLIKKYNQYHGLENDEDEQRNLFCRCRFLKQVSTKLLFGREGDIYTQKVPVIGTTWEFDFDESSHDLINFALDAGLGEWNSLGFGFMNVKRGQGWSRNCNN